MNDSSSSSSSIIKAIVFDLGGVILGSPLEGIAEFERACGIPNNFINISIVQHGANGAFHKLERGEIGVQQFINDIKTELDSVHQMKRFVTYLQNKNKQIPDQLPSHLNVDTTRLYDAMMSKARIVNETMAHAAFCLRGLHFQVIALTNNWKEDNEVGDSSSTNLIRPYFDQIIESCVLGYRKPSPKIFQYATELLNVQTSQILFLDDIGTNLKAARRFGWNTIQVKRPQQALYEMCQYLGLALDTFEHHQIVRSNIPTQFGSWNCRICGLVTQPMIILLHQDTFAKWVHIVEHIRSLSYCAIEVRVPNDAADYDDLAKRLNLQYRKHDVIYLIDASVFDTLMQSQHNLQAFAREAIVIQSAMSVISHESLLSLNVPSTLIVAKDTIDGANQIHTLLANRVQGSSKL